MAIINGTENTDIIIGKDESDAIFGRGGIDVLLGEDGNDRLYGEEGNDRLDGGSGSDTLSGGNGNDLIAGSFLYNSDYPSKDINDDDRDILYGGGGADTFILGSYTGGNFYVSNNDSDLAIIEDFQSGEDKIQLAGNANLYTMTNFGSNTNIYYQGDNSENDLLVIIKSNNDLDFASSDFDFV